jgi:replicative DNA helicase
MVGRIPPHNLEAEMAVLGAMLLGDRGGIERATEVLTRDDFYRDAHAHIYDGMIALTEKDEPVDIVTLKDELNRKGILEGIGGVGYLMQLGDIQFTTANIVYYAKIVQEKAILRRLIEASSQIAGSAYGEVEEVTELVDRAERTIFEVARQRGGKGFTPLRPIINELFEKIDTLYHDKGVTTGVDTGYKDLNYITSGLQDGDLIIIAARPSMGKTSLAIGIGQNAATMSGKSVAVFSLEMSKEQLVQRMLCSEAKVDAHRLRTGYLHDEDWHALALANERLWNANVFIDDSTDMSALEMRAKCRRLRAEYGLDLIIVDYLQLMRGSGKNEGNRNEEITTIARGLKSLARELSVPVIALSQLSRAVERREDKRPMLSDLRESGSIEAEADVVAFIYRPAYYERKESVSQDQDEKAEEDRRANNSEYEGDEAELIIAKQRNGPTGTVKLAFLPKYARFDNLAVGREENPF